MHIQLCIGTVMKPIFLNFYRQFYHSYMCWNTAVVHKVRYLYPGSYILIQLIVTIDLDDIFILSQSRNNS